MNGLLELDRWMGGWMGNLLFDGKIDEWIKTGWMDGWMGG